MLRKYIHFFFFSLTHDISKRCLLILSQAIKKKLVPITEQNNEKNYPSLEENVGQKCINQNSTIWKHKNTFKKPTELCP